MELGDATTIGISSFVVINISTIIYSGNKYAYYLELMFGKPSKHMLLNQNTNSNELSYQ